MFWPQDNPSRRSSDAGFSVAMDEEQCFFCSKQQKKVKVARVVKPPWKQREIYEQT